MATTESGGTDARLSILETEVQGIKSSLSDLARNLNRFMERQNEQRAPIPFKEILSSIVGTLFILGALAGTLDYWFDKKSAVAEYRLQQLEKHTAPSAK